MLLALGGQHIGTGGTKYWHWGDRKLDTDSVGGGLDAGHWGTGYWALQTLDTPDTGYSRYWELQILDILDTGHSRYWILCHLGGNQSNHKTSKCDLT